MLYRLLLVRLSSSQFHCSRFAIFSRIYVCSDNKFIKFLSLLLESSKIISCVFLKDEYGSTNDIFFQWVSLKHAISTKSYWVCGKEIFVLSLCFVYIFSLIFVIFFYCLFSLFYCLIFCHNLIKILNLFFFFYFLRFSVCLIYFSETLSLVPICAQLTYVFSISVNL